MYEKVSDVYGNSTAVLEDTRLRRNVQLGIFVALILVVVLGNGNIIYQLVRKKFLKVRFYLYVLHMCCLYIVFGLLVLPGYILQFYLEGFWPLGPAACIAWNLANNLSVYEMEVTIVLIALGTCSILQYLRSRITENMFVPLTLDSRSMLGNAGTRALQTVSDTSECPRFDRTFYTLHLSNRFPHCYTRPCGA